MANISKTVEIVFGAIDNTGDGLKSVSDGLGKFESSVGSVTGPLANVTEGLLKTEAAVLALAAAYGGFAIAKSIEFQTSQIDLAKVLSDTDPAIESFTEGVINLSEQYGISSAAILQGIANFKQAGFTAIESAKLQKDALDLVIAGDVEAAKASEILVASLKGFGVGAENATRFIEALNNVSNEYATDLEELATGMARISPVASKMGFSFEETTGLITPIIEVFRSGSEGANALRTGLLKLIDDSKPVGDALEKIGVSQRDTNGAMRSGKDIFLDVAKAFKTLDENQKLVVTSQLVGVEQAAKMVVVFDNLSKVQAITNVAMKETGSVTQEVALRLASAGKQVDIATQSFNNLAKSVGDELLPSFGQIAGGTTDIIKAFRDVVEDGGLAPLFDALDGQGKDFAEFLQGIAKALPNAFDGLDFSGLLDSFSSLKESIGDLFGDLDLTKPEDLQEALQNLVNFLQLMTNASAGAIEGLKPLIDGLVLFLEELANSDSETQNFIGNIGGIATAINALLPILSFLGNALEIVGGIFLASKGFEAFGGSIADITKKIPALSTKITSLALTLGKGGLVASAGAAGYALGEFLDVAGFINDKIGGENDTLGTWVYDLLHSGDDETTSKAFSNVSESIDGLGIELEKNTDLVESNKEEYDSLDDKLEDVGLSTEEAEQHFKNLAIQQGKSSEATEDLAGSSKELIKWNSQFPNVAEETNKALEKTADSTDKLTESQKIAIQNTQDLEIKLLELASNEKISAMEFTADIKVAEFEADAKRVEAAFTAASDIIAETAGAVADLYGLLGDPDLSNWDKSTIEKAAREQQKLEEQAIRNATKLNDAQVEYMRARTEALKRGDAQIKIDADNLQPELVAVLKSILNEIQITANAEGLEMLI